MRAAWFPVCLFFGLLAAAFAEVTVSSTLPRGSQLVLSPTPSQLSPNQVEATAVVPHEIVPLQPEGGQTLDENQDDDALEEQVRDRGNTSVTSPDMALRDRTN